MVFRYSKMAKFAKKPVAQSSTSEEEAPKKPTKKTAAKKESFYLIGM